MKNVDADPIGIVDDNITLTNPLLPGVEVVQPRASLPSLAESGWVEKKSLSASAAAKTKSSPAGDNSPEEGTK